MDDATLKQNVIDELAWRPDLNSAHIGVIADKGVIALTGYVSSYAQRYEAEQCVKGVAGVRGLAEDLEVRYADDWPSTKDDEIAKRAINSLAWDTRVPRDSVKVSVENGFVNLSGQVNWQFERNAAENSVRKLYGVVGVTNDITLRTQPLPGDIKSRIDQRPAR
jgi:osmotically-inducible protein OsmY